MSVHDILAEHDAVCNAAAHEPVEIAPVERSLCREYVQVQSHGAQSAVPVLIHAEHGRGVPVPCDVDVALFTLNVLEVIQDRDIVENDSRIDYHGIRLCDISCGHNIGRPSGDVEYGLIPFRITVSGHSDGDVVYIRTILHNAQSVCSVL